MATKTSRAQSETTTDHDKIRKWVETRKGKPATVAGTAKSDEGEGLLRIDFPTGASNPPLEPISWEDFFEKFDQENLALVYEEKDGNGELSYFCKFISR